MTFQEILLRRGIRFRTTSGDSAKTHLNCPFCISRGKEADNKFRLCVHTKQGWGKCVHCEWKSRDAVSYVLKHLGILDSVTGSERNQKKEFLPVELPKDFIPLSRPYDDLDFQAANYLIRRGITREQIKNHKIGVSYTGRYAYRILFPVYIGKELKFINARDFTDRQKPKYLNSLGDKYLFNFNKESETCILSEGVFKALRIERVSEVNSSSLLGHDLTETQYTQIKESKCKRILLYPDLDIVGRKGLVKIADALSEKWNGVVEVFWPVFKPADEVLLNELKASLQNAVSYSRVVRSKLLLNRP